MQLLLIEDDDDFRRDLGEALADLGHEVVAARDGQAGWSMLLAGVRPDAIILDLMMPHMNGQAFRTQQLAREDLAAIPTLVLTAVPRIDAITRAAVGATPVLAKPVALRALLAALDEVVAPPHDAKRCKCGRVYDLPSWKRLRRVGVADNGRGVGEQLELRNCTCGSTIAWELGRHALSVPSPDR